jgi:hypothetical protein
MIGAVETADRVAAVNKLSATRRICVNAKRPSNSLGQGGSSNNLPTSATYHVVPRQAVVIDEHARVVVVLAGGRCGALTARWRLQGLKQCAIRFRLRGGIHTE